MDAAVVCAVLFHPVGCEMVVDVVALAYMRYLVTVCVVDIVAVMVVVVVSSDQSPPGASASTDGVSASRTAANAAVKRILMCRLKNVVGEILSSIEWADCDGASLRVCDLLWSAKGCVCLL